MARATAQATTHTAPAPKVPLRFEITDTGRDALDAADDHLRNVQEAATKLEAVRLQYAEIKDVRERLIEGGEDAACPLCDHALHAHYRAVLDHMDDQMATLVSDARFFCTRLEQLDAGEADGAVPDGAFADFPGMLMDEDDDLPF